MLKRSEVWRRRRDQIEMVATIVALFFLVLIILKLV